MGYRFEPEGVGGFKVFGGGDRYLGLVQRAGTLQRGKRFDEGYMLPRAGTRALPDLPPAQIYRTQDDAASALEAVGGEMTV